MKRALAAAHGITGMALFCRIGGEASAAAIAMAVARHVCGGVWHRRWRGGQRRVGGKSIAAARHISGKRRWRSQ